QRRHEEARPPSQTRVGEGNEGAGEKSPSNGFLHLPAALPHRDRPRGTADLVVRRAVTRRRAPRADDRGAVLVEFALVFPILAMLLFGVISAGLAWNQHLALAQGARLGGRYGATLPTHHYPSLDG